MTKQLSHTFAICAYKESPFLEECVKSVLEQEIKTNVLIATSTPNDYISSIAKKYNVPLHINTGDKGITQDWNFAYKMAKSDLVTIAHQDDVYLSHYTKEIYALVSKAKKPLIVFTDYGELRNGEAVVDNSLLKIKRLLLFPIRFFKNSKFVRRRCLSLGNCICCPAVTFVKDNLPEVVFQHHFRSNEDWEAWEMISKIKGAFLYSRNVGMYHRIHEGSETSAIIGDNARTVEDYEMFQKFWPDCIAKIIAKVYAKSEESNQV